ncbi:MAG: ATP-binding protein [Pseudoflavonifractor sp.]
MELALQKNGGRHVILTLLAILMIGSSLLLTFAVYYQYKNTIVANEDEQMLRLTRSVSQNIESYLSRYESGLQYVAGQTELAHAEADFLAGDPAALVQVLGENMLNRDALTTATVLRDEDGVILYSTNGTTEYQPVNAAHMVPNQIIRQLFTDGSHHFYLGFCLLRENGLTYEILVELCTLYGRVVADVGATEGSAIMLLDHSRTVLVYNNGEENRADEITALDAATGYCSYDALPIFLEHEIGSESTAAFYQAEHCRSGHPHRARLVVCPTAAGINDFFAVGATINFDQKMEPIHHSAGYFLPAGIMLTLGVILLIAQVEHAGRSKQKAQRELELLREKHAAVEELNRQNNELAHHQRLQSIGEMSSGIAHEFNNLLTPIMGYSIMTLEQLSDEDTELYDNILEIYNASRKAKEIVSRISELSRKPSSASFRAIAPNLLLHKVLEMAQTSKPLKVTVVTDFAAQPPKLYGNETQLSQLFLNLVLNAFHAMGDKGGVLTLGTAASTSGGTVIEVADEGCGIPPEAMSHIFEPFFTTREAGVGTGLGLTIVQQVAEAHKAAVQVESKPDVGTHFTLTFPASRQNEVAEG